MEARIPAPSCADRPALERVSDFAKGPVIGDRGSVMGDKMGDG